MGMASETMLSQNRLDLLPKKIRWLIATQRSTFQQHHRYQKTQPTTT
jgi:hypothetical protein